MSRRGSGNGGAQDKAGDDEALGLVGLLGQVRVVGAHVAVEPGGDLRRQGRGSGRKEPHKEPRAAPVLTSAVSIGKFTVTLLHISNKSNCFSTAFDVPPS